MFVLLLLVIVGSLCVNPVIDDAAVMVDCLVLLNDDEFRITSLTELPFGRSEKLLVPVNSES